MYKERKSDLSFQLNRSKPETQFNNITHYVVLYQKNYVDTTTSGPDVKPEQLPTESEYAYPPSTDSWQWLTDDERFPT